MTPPGPGRSPPSGTRGQILALVRREDHTIPELAAELGLSDTAVRNHLMALQRDGFVAQAGVRRDTGGKPARIYGLTEKGEEAFLKAYDVVLTRLVEVLKERLGPDAARSVLRQAGRRAADGPADRARDGGGPGGGVEAAVQVLEGLGGSLRVEREDGGWLLVGDGCPLSAVVRGHPEACSVVEALLSELTGRAVRQRCLHGARPRCRFVVEGEDGAGP